MPLVSVIASPKGSSDKELRQLAKHLVRTILEQKPVVSVALILVLRATARARIVKAKTTLVTLPRQAMRVKALKLSLKLRRY
jgi:hypothetical protein